MPTISQAEKRGASPLSVIFRDRILVIFLSVLYAAIAAASAWIIVDKTQASTADIEQILNLYGLKNEGAQALSSYTKKHPLFGMFISSPVRSTLKLPSKDQAGEALHADVPHLLKSVRQKSNVAAWWSCFLLTASLAYVIAVVTSERSFVTRAVVFSLTIVSFTFFMIGIIAPVMVVWTAPTIPMETGDLNFVVQHQVRGIAAIIWELLTGGHWIVGGFLLLFSIITPMTKASLTFFVTASRSHALNFRIGRLLHSIGKWSMADVFVAALILGLYALKFQQATKSIPCLGLYYFIGYCLLSLGTTELLIHTGLVSREVEKRTVPPLSGRVMAGLLAGVVCFALAAGAYTYQQYTLNLNQSVSAETPRELNNANLVLPVHK